MNALFNLYDRVFMAISGLMGDWFLPTLARFAFAAVLFKYFWGSALTKLGGGIGGLFVLDPNAYVQIFPKAMEAVGYDPAGLGILHKVIAVVGTWGEIVLPILIVVGLFTRLAALGMIGFVAVQTLVDVTGHGAKLGTWFNNASGELIADQRLLWFMLFAILIAKGAGPFSLDRVLKRH